jgi:hypothetical protein
MHTLKNYSQTVAVRTFMTFEWILGWLTRCRPWIPLACISLVVGFTIGYLFLGQ